jgi:hypothetical protein
VKLALRCLRLHRLVPRTGPVRAPGRGLLRPIRPEASLLRDQSLGQAPSDQGIRLTGPAPPGFLRPRLAISVAYVVRPRICARRAILWAYEYGSCVAASSPPASFRSPISTAGTMWTAIPCILRPIAGDIHLGARDFRRDTAGRIDARTRAKVLTSSHHNLLIRRILGVPLGGPLR